MSIYNKTYKYLNYHSLSRVLVQSESKFNEFEPRLESAKKLVSIERRLKSWNIDYNLKWNQLCLSLKFKPQLKFFKFGLRGFKEGGNTYNKQCFLKSCTLQTAKGGITLHPLLFVISEHWKKAMLGIELLLFSLDLLGWV